MTPAIRRIAPLLLVLLLGSACAECGEEVRTPVGRDAGPADVRPGIAYADLDDLQQLVVLGDSVAAGYGVPMAANFVSLLMSNDDDSYPEFAGRDLDTLRPGSDRYNLAIDGARIDSVVEVQLPNVPDNASIVILAVGSEDYLDTFGSSAEDGAAAAAEFGAKLDQVLGALRSLTRFTLLPHVYLVNLIDPSDEVGDLGALIGGGTWSDGLTVLQAFNNEIARRAVNFSAHLVDAHSAFLGHGGHFDDATSVHYHSADPSAWLQNDLVRPSRRGHSELRGLLLDEILP